MHILGVGGEALERGVDGADVEGHREELWGSCQIMGLPFFDKCSARK